MRVAVIDHSSSIEMYDHCLAEALVAQGCNVLFLNSDSLYASFNHHRSYQTQNHFYRRTNRLLKKWKLLARFRKLIRVFEYVFDMLSLLRLLRRYKPDVIHFETLPLPMIDMWFILRLKRIARVVVTAHDTSHRGESRVQFWGFFRCLRLFDHVITLTSFSRQRVISQAGIPEKRVSVIPHGAQLMPIAPGGQSEPRADEGEAEKVILFFGVIKHYKGLDVLITALSRLPQELLSRCRLVVAGLPFMDVRPLQRMATELGVGDRITWDLRYIPDEEVGSYFADATVVVFPYREIDQSGGLHIAIGSGKPIIATEVGGMPEIMCDGVHGYLVPPEDPDALARALERILIDQERTHEMALAVGHLADSLSWDAISLKTVDVYSGL